MKKTAIFLAPIMFIGGALTGCRLASHEVIPAKIEAAYIGIHYYLLGVCGLPLGEPFEIEGSFVQDTGPWGDTGYGSLLSISVVNGKRLSQPIEIDVEALERRRWRRPVGTAFHLRVLEWANFYEVAPINQPAAIPTENSVRDYGKPEDEKRYQRMEVYVHILADLNDRNSMKKEPNQTLEPTAPSGRGSS